MQVSECPRLVNAEESLHSWRGTVITFRRAYSDAVILVDNESGLPNTTNESAMTKPTEKQPLRRKRLLYIHKSRAFRGLHGQDIPGFVGASRNNGCIIIENGLLAER